MSTMREQHAWHIQNLIESEDDCLVVLLAAAEDLETKYAAVCAELEELQDSLSKVKADAVREAVNDVVQNLMMYNGTDLDVECTDDLLRYADKLEQGE